MNQYKIIFTGPVGAGKTTAIKAISDVPPVVTEAVASDPEKTGKAETTVALDYGIINLGDGDKVHLYGTPGQERFDFMWDILVTGGLGLILLLDNSKPDPFADLHFYLNAFKAFIAETNVAIGITHMDGNEKPTLADYHAQLQAIDLKPPPIFAIDARTKKEVSLLVRALLISLDPGLEG